MSSQENKVQARLFEEGFSRRNTDVVDEVLNPDFVCYDPKLETIKAEIEYFPNAVPDLTYTIEDQIAEGDTAVTRYTVSDTHQGEFFGVPHRRAYHDVGYQHPSLRRRQDG